MGRGMTLIKIYMLYLHMSGFGLYRFDIEEKYNFRLYSFIILLFDLFVVISK